LAAAIGTTPCVVAGGIVTLGIAGLMSVVAPQLRNLRFDPKTMERV
jgi:hypothetical protein